MFQKSKLGLYGLLFRRNKEAAFSNYRLWESAGFVIAYAYSTTLCARMKLYILFGNLTLGVLGYIIVEIRYRRKVISICFVWNAINFYKNLIFNSQKNSNDDLRNKKPKKMPVKLKQLNNRQIKLKKLTTNTMNWKRILKSLTSKCEIFVCFLFPVSYSHATNTNRRDINNS